MRMSLYIYSPEDATAAVSQYVKALLLLVTIKRLYQSFVDLSVCRLAALNLLSVRRALVVLCCVRSFCIGYSISYSVTDACWLKYY